MKAREINQKMRSIMNTKVGLKAVGVFAVYIAMTSILNIIGVFLKTNPIAYATLQIMLFLLVVFVLGIGYTKYNLDLLRGKQVTLSTLFEGFARRYFLKTVLTILLFLLFVLGFALLYFIINMIFVYGLGFINIGFWIVQIISLLSFFYGVMLVSQIYYRMIDNPSASAWKAFTSSITMMKGRVWNNIVQTLSLLPLFLLPIILVIVEQRDTVLKGGFDFAVYASAPISSFTTESILLYIANIIVSLLVEPRISMSFAIWYDDKARAANLQIEE